MVLIRKASGQQMTTNHSEYLKAWKGVVGVRWQQGQVRPGKERNAVEPSRQDCPVVTIFPTWIWTVCIKEP